MSNECQLIKPRPIDPLQMKKYAQRMSIQHIPLNKLNEGDLQSLLDTQTSESKFLDYKLELPGTQDKDKKEFLYDITSFANAGGGDLIFGVSEKKENGKNTGLPEKLMGLPDANLDHEILRLEQIIRNGIDPRIIGVQLKSIHLASGNPVLIIRIPKSWHGPHAVTLADTFRFYSRNSAGKYPLDVGELKNAFLSQSSIQDQIRQFMLKRISSIVAKETPVNIFDEPLIVVHIVPLDNRQILDLGTIYSTPSKWTLLYTSLANFRYNLDGLVGYGSGRDGHHLSYTQIYRNGIIEGVGTGLSNEQFLSAGEIEKKIIAFVKNNKLLLLENNIKGPLFVAINLLFVKGLKIPSPDRLCRFEREETAIDRDTLVLPDVLIEDDDSNIESKLRPCFDALWQSAGWPRSLSYDDDGNRIR